MPQVATPAKEEKARNVILKQGATVEELVRALTAIGSTARDIIAILENLRAAGALEAELEVQSDARFRIIPGNQPAKHYVERGVPLQAREKKDDPEQQDPPCRATVRVASSRRSLKGAHPDDSGRMAGNWRR